MKIFRCGFVQYSNYQNNRQPRRLLTCNKKLGGAMRHIYIIIILFTSLIHIMHGILLFNAHQASRYRAKLRITFILAALLLE